MRPPQLARVPTLLAFALTATLISPPVARAQELSVGTRVRVSVPAFKIEKRTGIITHLTADTLSVDFGRRRPRLTTAIDGVSALEVSAGKSRSAGFVYGASIGVLAGAVMGLAAGAMWLQGCTSSDGPPCELIFIVTTPAGAAIGLIAGGIIGAAHPPDRWEEVSLRRGPSGLGIRGVVQPMRFGLSVSF